MSARVRLGQMCCVAATMVLLLVLPWRPASLGVPYARIHETGAIWIAYALSLWGAGWARSSIGSLTGDETPARQLKGGLNAASGAMCLTALAALVSLTSILATTLDGARFITLPFGRGELYPSELNYALAAPLALALLCHGPLLVMQLPSAAASPAPTAKEIIRGLLLAAIGLLLMLYLLTALGSFADRWFVVGAVVVTWIASWLYLALSLEQLAWSTSLQPPNPSPFAPRP